MLLRSSILAGVATLALVGFGQAAPAAMPSGQTTTAPSTPSTMPADQTATPAQGIKLSEVQNPKTTLRGASVKDSKGDAIGEVKSFQLSSDG